jgi:hypothetical protein
LKKFVSFWLIMTSRKKGVNRPDERAVFGFDNDSDLPA